LLSDDANVFWEIIDISPCKDIGNSVYEILEQMQICRPLSTTVLVHIFKKKLKKHATCMHYPSLAHARSMGIWKVGGSIRKE